MGILIVGENDLQTWCLQNDKQNFLDEWDYATNALKPTDIAYGSSMKVNWICPQGHKYQTSANGRTHQGSGCPYCSGKRVLAGFNDLQTWCMQNNYVSILDEWDYENNNLKPTEVLHASGKKIKWVCSQGHKYQMVISKRTVNGRGCPYCSGHRVLVGFNDFCTWCILNGRERILDEWDASKNVDITPEMFAPMSKRKIWWKCRYGHEWQAPIYSRSYSGYSCPKCSARGTSLPEQGIAYYLEKVCKVEQRVKIAGKEIDVYLPEYRIGIEYDGKRYHTAETVSKETDKDLQVATMSVKLIHIKESDKNYVEDNVIYFDIDYLRDNYDWAICRLCERLVSLTGNSVFSSIEVNAQKDMLNIYAKLDRYSEEKSLARVRPDLAKDWHSTKNGTLTPEMFSVCSNVKVWWKCFKGHEWQSQINARWNGSGCPFCCGKQVLAGYNDLATEHPELLKDWDFTKNMLKPSEITSASNKKVWWKCSQCGLEWQSTVGNRVCGGTGCPNCCIKEGANLRIRNYILKVGSLADTFPEIAKEWHPSKNGDLTPSDVSSRCQKRVYWLCPAGHEYQRMIKIRVGRRGDGNGAGCPYCK